MIPQTHSLILVHPSLPSLLSMRVVSEWVRPLMGAHTLTLAQTYSLLEPDWQRRSSKPWRLGTLGGLADV